MGTEPEYRAAVAHYMIQIHCYRRVKPAPVGNLRDPIAEDTFFYKEHAVAVGRFERVKTADKHFRKHVHFLGIIESLQYTHDLAYFFNFPFGFS